MEYEADDWVESGDKGFLAHVGPLLRLKQPGPPIFGLLARDHHHNVRGVMQGGMVATLLDKTIGTNIRHAYPDGGYATIELNVRYFLAVKIGDFVICRAKVDHRTSKLTHGSGKLSVDGKVVAAATGVWRNLGT